MSAPHRAGELPPVIEPGTNRLIDFRRACLSTRRPSPGGQTAERLIERGFVKRAGK
jgi:hypothetical protein